MNGLSSMSADTRNKAIAIGAFVLIAAGVLYYELFAGGTPNPAAVAPANPAPAATANTGAANDAGAPAASGAARPAAGGNAAHRLTSGSAALDPALRMEAMLLSEQVEYSGVGRNIFSPNSAPPPPPKPIASPRPNPASLPPPPPVRTGPPPPPPIDLTFFGTETDPTGKLWAILLHQGDAVYTAQAGDIVLRRYRIVTINAKSIQVEDMVTNSKQTLPLVAN